MPRFGRDGRSPTRRLLISFVLTTIVPAGALAWLGWMLVRQDLVLDAEPRRDARERAAELAATALQRTLAELEEQLSTFTPGRTVPDGTVSPGVALATLNEQGLVAPAGLSLPFYPASEGRASSALPPVFEQAEALEFLGKDTIGALALLVPVTASPAQNLRAEALLRVGRLHRKAGNTAEALSAFDRLGALDATPVGGQPAGLVAAQARALVLAATQGSGELRKTAAELLESLDRGRWPLTRSDLN